MKRQILTDAGRMLVQQWQLPELQLREEASEYLTHLKHRLADRIRELLETDMEHLINLLYRLDISETDFQRAMQGDHIYHTAQDLAEIVLNRELQKARTRAAYRNR